MANDDPTEQHAQTMRAAFVQEAQASMASFSRGGLHLTGEEVRLWLYTWGEPEHEEVPAAHP